MKQYSKDMLGQDDKPFNMAILFLMRLNTRLDECNQARIEGNLLKWYRGLRAVYSMIHFKVIEAGHEKSETELIELFEKVKRLLRSPQNIKDAALTAQLSSVTLTGSELILDELEIKLHTLLYHYDLIFPPQKKQKTFTEQLEDDY